MSNKLFKRLCCYLLLLIPAIKGFSQSDTADNSFSLPLRKIYATSAYGWRVHPFTGRKSMHNGIDLAAHQDSVYNISEGVIERVGHNPVLGNYILIRHNGLLQSLYAHLSAISVLPGDKVFAGDIIGITGLTGKVTGEHLHLTIKYKGHAISPLKFLLGLCKPP